MLLSDLLSGMDPILIGNVNLMSLILLVRNDPINAIVGIGSIDETKSLLFFFVGKAQFHTLMSMVGTTLLLVITHE